MYKNDVIHANSLFKKIKNMMTQIIDTTHFYNVIECYMSYVISLPSV